MSAGHGETAIPPKFDPYIQSFNLTRNDGTTFVTDMATLDYLRTYGTRLAINYGSQIGASIVLLLVLFVLTRAEKRKSGIFIMNSICLFVNMCRAIVQALWLTGNWFNPYAFISFDSSHITKGDIANSVAANVLTMILYIGVMISLSLQVWVVCITTPKLQRFLIMGSTTLIALIACGYRFAITVISAEQTVAMNPEGMEPYQGLLTTTTILTTTAIWTYCAVFTFKLGFALIQRRKLGMAQFGPMQIIFIMGCQTMVIPGVFTLPPALIPLPFTPSSSAFSPMLPTSCSLKLC
jgi:pheromone alpha factor receptor